MTSIGMVIKAKADLAAGDFICAYGGVDDGKKMFDSAYRAGKIDGTIVRSYGCLAPDSWPNAALAKVKRACGRTRLALIAYTPIRKGEVICYDYGSQHYMVKELDQVELRLKSLYRYWDEYRVFSDTQLEGFARSTLKLTSSETETEFRQHWREIYPAVVHSYCENTPSAFVRVQLHLLAQQEGEHLTVNTDPRLRPSRHFEEMVTAVSLLNTLPQPKTIVKTLLNRLQDSRPVSVVRSIMHFNDLAELINTASAQNKNALGCEKIVKLVDQYLEGIFITEDVVSAITTAKFRRAVAGLEERKS